jgi:hypothetical protein
VIVDRRYFLDKINQFNRKNTEKLFFNKLSNSSDKSTDADPKSQIEQTKNSVNQAMSAIYKPRNNEVNYDFSDFNKDDTKGIKFLT